MDKKSKMYKDYEYLRDVVKDTCDTIVKGSYISPEGTKVDLSEGIKKLKLGTEMIQKPERLEEIENPTTELKITVENKGTWEKAGEEGWQEDAVCLNMASEFMPGGGVWSGSKTQEEELCRRSTLLRSLYMFGDARQKNCLGIGKNQGKKEKYPLSPGSVIYSPHVEVIKDSKYAYLNQPFYTNVVSSAALRKPTLTPEGTYHGGQRVEMQKRIRSILRTAAIKGKRKLILGAWGCGAFCNPPKEVASLFLRVLKGREMKGWFDEVCFAIIDNFIKKESNYKIFKSIIENEN